MIHHSPVIALGRANILEVRRPLVANQKAWLGLCDTSSSIRQDFPNGLEAQVVKQALEDQWNQVSRFIRHRSTRAGGAWV